MQLEVRFTVKNTTAEIPFTIVEGASEERWFLYSKVNNQEIKYPLINENGILRLENGNPFEESDDILNERLIGLSSEWIENRSQGFDNTIDFEDIEKPGYGPDDIFVENKPFSLKQIVDLIHSGDIELAPSFQRNFIWDKTRQSKLIESILLGLPLPSIYLSQYEDGKLTVVDGLQRLTTIKNFMNDDISLTNLEYLEECNNKRFSELEGILSPLRIRRFGQTQIMCFVIDYRSPSQLKYDLFRRLNTGGKPLNNQEIRNCLSKPFVQKILLNMIDQTSFYNATGGSVKDSRMEAREAALRFIYFYEQYQPTNPTGKYSGDMEKTLDEFTDELNKRSFEKLLPYIAIYNKALADAYDLFGDLCFRKVLPETLGGRKSPINKLIMLTFSVLLAKLNLDLDPFTSDSYTFVKKLADFIKEEDQLFEAITYGTNGKWNIDLGFKSFDKFIKLYLLQS